MQIGERINIKKIVIEIVGTIFGSFFIAIGISLFLLPNQLSSGGISGIATLTYYLFDISMGKMILMINIPLFLFSVYKVGKSFFIKSLIGTFSLSIFIDLLDKLQPLTDDRFLACVYGGIIIGLGTAIILRANSSTGGSDLVGYVVKKYNPTIRSGNVIMIIDGIIITLNMIFLKEIEIGLYSVIAIYLMSKVIDVVFEGIYFTKLIIIISDKNEKIAKEIGEKIKRGTTGLYGRGMYTDEDKLVLMCAASRKDVSQIRLISRRIDKNSFIIITNSREVVGEGFKKN